MAVVGIDSRPEVLEAAAAADRRVTAARGLELHIGDGRSLPYPDAAFDIVHTSLMLHHLEPIEVRTLLTEMVRVARRGVVVERPRPRATRRGRGVAAGPPDHAQPLHAQRRAPFGAARVSTAELERMIEAAGLRIVARHRAIARHRVALAAVPMGTPLDGADPARATDPRRATRP